jgi:hypothetical protein
MEGNAFISRWPRRRRRPGRLLDVTLSAALLLALAADRLAAQTTGWEQSVQVSANAWYGAARARVVATELGVSRTDSTVTVRSDLHLGYADDRVPDGPRRVTARDEAALRRDHVYLAATDVVILDANGRMADRCILIRKDMR